MFYGCSNLNELNINNFKLIRQCNIKSIFNGIDKTKCKMIVQDENLKNIFLNSKL